MEKKDKKGNEIGSVNWAEEVEKRLQELEKKCVRGSPALTRAIQNQIPMGGKP